MRKDPRLIGFRNCLATAAIAVSLVTGANLPAAAHVGAGMRANRAVREHVLVRKLKYEPIQSGVTVTSSAPPDYCDLPSAGCESYLSN
jgi:hypothetical protein